MVRSGIPIEPGTPEWFKRFALRNEQAWVPREPQGPQRLFAAATVDLPDPAAYPFCIAYDLTLGAPVTSNGTVWS